MVRAVFRRSRRERDAAPARWSSCSLGAELVVEEVAVAELWCRAGRGGGSRRREQRPQRARDWIGSPVRCETGWSGWAEQARFTRKG